MKRVPCAGPGCSERRVHFEEPFTLREQPRIVNVPDDFEGNAYCSIECAVYAGKFKVQNNER